MIGEFNPQKLLIPKSGGTFAIKFNITDGEYVESFDSFRITSTNSSNYVCSWISVLDTQCIFQITAAAYNSTIPEDFVLILYLTSETGEPFSFKMPITQTVTNNGFYPALAELKPYTGCSDSFYYVNGSTGTTSYYVTCDDDLIKINSYVPCTTGVFVDYAIAENAKYTENKIIPIKVIRKTQNNPTGLSYFFSVTVEGYPKEITYNPQSPLEIPSLSGSSIINISANYDSDNGNGYSITYNSPEIKEAYVNEDGRNATLIINSNTNTTASVRTAAITVNYGTYSDNYAIKQQAYIKGNIAVEDDVLYATCSQENGIDSVIFTNVNTVTVSSNSNWLTATLVGNEVNYRINSNLGGKRTGIITLAGKDSNNQQITATITVNQSECNIFPIAKDIYANFITNEDCVNYNITQNDEVIYYGRAYRIPNDLNIKFNINKIVSNYLNSSLSENLNADYICNYKINENYAKNFKVTNTNNNQLIGDYTFFNDYSYIFESLEKRADKNGYINISQPINNVIDYRQLFLFSFYLPLANINTNTVYCFLINSKTGKKYMLKMVRPSENTEYNFVTNSIKNVENIEQYDEIIINNVKYMLLNSGCKYCLYYRNSYGGYDSFLIEGNDLKTDKITSNYYNSDYQNDTLDFQSKKYQNIIKTKYKLYSNYMTDDEASRMYHLIESNEVYLHNLENNNIVPVNITDSECEYKTFSNNGKKKIKYVINLEESQTKIRK